MLSHIFTKRLRHLNIITRNIDILLRFLFTNSTKETLFSIDLKINCSFQLPNNIIFEL